MSLAIFKYANDLRPKSLSKIIYLILVTICFLFFNFQYDMGCLIIGGNLILDGHILDWYEAFDELRPSIGVYPIPYFFLYAIWNIPIRLISQQSFLDVFSIPLYVSLWNKLSVLLMMWRLNVSLSKVLEKLNKDNVLQTKNVWLYMPVTFFVCVVMGMYDVLYVLCVVEALNFYYSDWSIKKNQLFFTLIFGISICFKTLPVVFFIPLLLAKEKKIINIIKHLCIFIIPYFLVILPYLRSEKFIQNCLLFSGTGSDMLFSNTIVNIIPTIVIWIIASCLAYILINPDKSSFEKNTIILSNVVTTTIFGLAGMFHPQWFLLAIPFIVCLFSFINSKYNYVFLILQGMVSITYLSRIFIQYPTLPFSLVDDGILGYRGLNLISSNANLILNAYTKIDIKLIGSILFALLVCQILFAVFPVNNEMPIDNSIKKWMLDFLIIGSLSFYFIPLILGFMPFISKNIYATNMDPIGENTICYQVLPDQELGQSIVINKPTEISKITFRPITWNYQYNETDNLVLKIMGEDGTIYYEKKIFLSEFKDYELYTLELSDVFLEKGTYLITFKLGNALTGNNQLGITYLNSGELVGSGYAYLWGKEDLTIDMQLAVVGK